MAKILIVEDEVHILRVMALWIERHGHKVLEANNGCAALQVLDDHVVDLIISDMNMPEMGGLEVLKEVRGDGNSNNIPIVMCTSVADKSQVMDAIKAGASNYVVKPFTPEDLQKKVQKYLK